MRCGKMSGMAHTLVCLHAHPDDEALLTAGVMAKAAAEGHRVVLVVATRGEVGQVAGDFLGRRTRPWPTAAGTSWSARPSCSASPGSSGSATPTRATAQPRRVPDRARRPEGPTAVRRRRSTRPPPAAGRPSCARSTPTCSPPTTPTAATATPTTAGARGRAARRRAGRHARSCSRPPSTATSCAWASSWPPRSASSCRPTSPPTASTPGTPRPTRSPTPSTCARISRQKRASMEAHASQATSAEPAAPPAAWPCS